MEDHDEMDFAPEPDAHIAQTVSYSAGEAPREEPPLTSVFYLGECTVSKELKLEGGDSIGAGNETLLALKTTTRRFDENQEHCPICYYDSTDEKDDDLEHEFKRRTTEPVGRYSALCVCSSSTDNNNTEKAVCGHRFHTVCIYKWIKSDAGGFTCPVCRGGLQQQRLDGVPELFAQSPDFIVKRYANGKVHEEYFELAGKRDGLYRSYYSSGALELQCDYKAGLRHGCEVHHYENGNVKSRVEFDRDVKHGVSRWYTSHGKMIGEAHWANGHKSGSHCEWYTDSDTPRLSNLEHHLNGKRHGLFMKWSFSGKLLLYGVYVNDEKHGRFTAWYEQNYGIKIKEFYLNGIRHGRSVEYYEPSEDEQQQQQRRRQAGRAVQELKPIPKEEGYYEHGIKIGMWMKYWSNGQLKIRTEYDEDGNESGMHMEWNRFGRCTKVFRYDAGMLDGVCETYNPDTGLPLETAVYKAGQQHGLYVLRYKNGKPKLIRVFKYQQEMLTKWISRSGKIQTLYPVPEDTVSAATRLGRNSDAIKISSAKPRSTQHARARFVE